MTDAVVVGSGPNGLTAALVLARAGAEVTVLERARTIGGGTRTEELTVPGVLHDVCSAVHPFAVASPVLGSLGLDEHGLEWCWPEVDLAHPLDGGRAGVLYRSLARTVDGLGGDGPAWERAFGSLAADFDDLVGEIMQPMLHVPRHPIRLASFGVGALQPATVFARRWGTEEARALFAGVAGHAIRPLTHPTTAAIGITLIAAAHAVGWPVARGGSRAITDALADALQAAGGRIETGIDVTDLAQLPRTRVALFDVAPSAMVQIAGDRLPGHVRRAYDRYRHGPAAYKVDLAVEGGVPWTNPACRRAGTVHVGGSFEEVADAEATVHRGRVPERPFVLVGQQYVADASRSRDDVHPVWAYAHVPAGFPGDVTDAVLSQVERFAPGTRERVVGMAVRRPADLQADNPNYVGGDIATGANTPFQVVFRPRLAPDPYWTGVPGVFLCSAATPPGAGVHGMGGANAAERALRVLGA